MFHEQFVGAWEQLPGKYPEKVTEAQGTLVGNKLVLTGGFVGGIEKATLESYYLGRSLAQVLNHMDIFSCSFVI